MTGDRRISISPQIEMLPLDNSIACMHIHERIAIVLTIGRCYDEGYPIEAWFENHALGRACRDALAGTGANIQWSGDRVRIRDEAGLLAVLLESTPACIEEALNQRDDHSLVREYFSVPQQPRFWSAIHHR